MLHECQALYIARDKGRFESKRTGTLAVEEGAVILLFPGEWRHYRPSTEAGYHRNPG